MCLLSVILTTYKSPWEKIALTLDSIFSQNLNDFEIIIGDDSNLTISDVENYMGDLRPKKRENTKKLVIPKNKKKNGRYMKLIKMLNMIKSMK